MKILCKIFGHKLPEGYCGAPPYLRVKTVIIDGIGRKHAYMECACARCGEKYNVANVHLPETD